MTDKKCANCEHQIASGTGRKCARPNCEKVVCATEDCVQDWGNVCSICAKGRFCNDHRWYCEQCNTEFCIGCENNQLRDPESVLQICLACYMKRHVPGPDDTEHREGQSFEDKATSMRERLLAIYMDPNLTDSERQECAYHLMIRAWQRFLPPKERARRREPDAKHILPDGLLTTADVTIKRARTK